MNMWLAVVLVGLGSYAFRLLPLLLGQRIRLSQRLEATLRHTAIGALTALMVLGVKRITADPFGADMIPVVMSLAVSATAALLRRPMAVVVLCGGATYGVALGVLRIVTG